MSTRVIALLSLAPIGGVWADRWPRKRVMVIGALIRATICALIFIAGDSQSLATLASLVFLMGASEAFSGPAGSAIIPSVVESELLQLANALKAMSGRFASISGPGIAAGLIAAIGPRLGFLVTSILFLITAITLRSLNIRHVERERNRFGADIRAGIQFIRSTPWMALTMSIMALQVSILFGAEMVLLPVITKEAFDTARIYPLAIASLSLGSLISAYLAGRIQAKSPGRASFASWTFLGALLLALIFPLSPAFVLACYFIGGLATQPMGIFWATAMQRAIPEALRARVLSLDATLTGALVPLGMLIAGPLSEVIGASTYLWIVLALFMTLNVIALINKKIARFS